MDEGRAEVHARVGPAPPLHHRAHRTDRRHNTTTPLRRRGVCLIREGERLARWTVDRQVGGGTSAILYLAHDPTDGAQVELELLAPGADPARFAQILRCQGRVRHPNVVRVYEEVVTDTARGLAFQAIDGPTLADLLPRTSFSPAQLEAIASGLIAGLAAVHAAGVLHRDVRPENIRMARQGDDWMPLLTGFGHARLLASTPPPPEAGLVGVPGTMAPEQLRDPDRAGVAADVFSLGATLYALMCGLPPFAGPPAEIFDAIAAERYLLPRRLVELSPQTEAAIIGALHADPARRIPDVDSLALVWRGLPTKSGWVPWALPPSSHDGAGRNEWESLAERTLVPEPNAWQQPAPEAPDVHPEDPRGLAMSTVVLPAAVLFLAAVGAVLYRVFAATTPH